MNFTVCYMTSSDMSNGRHTMTVIVCDGASDERTRRRSGSSRSLFLNAKQFWTAAVTAKMRRPYDNHSSNFVCSPSAFRLLCESLSAVCGIVSKFFRQGDQLPKWHSDQHKSA